jgi:hypothetical protein
MFAVPHKAKYVIRIKGNWDSSQAFLATENDEQEEHHQQKGQNYRNNK